MQPTSFRSFVMLNRRLSKRLERERDELSGAYARYTCEVYRTLIEQDPESVLDVGAGQHWFFPTRLKKLGFRLIGSDIDRGELALNPALDERIVVDASTGLGVPNASVDVITARAAVEHFPDNRSFLRNCSNALKPGGTLVITFAGRNAPFALINRMLPETLSAWLLEHLIPEKREKLGFKAHYDRCTYSQITRAAHDAGLELVRYFYDFHSSAYFRFFVPAYLASASLDRVRAALDWKDLASYYVFVFRKPPKAVGAAA